MWLSNVHCRQHTETADFLGGFRPSRERERKTGAPPFMWADGPLVHAMRNGDLMLVDELNLAEDSVIERLNSVLEKPGLLVLAEKGAHGLRCREWETQGKRGGTVYLQSETCQVNRSALAYEVTVLSRNGGCFGLSVWRL